MPMPVDITAVSDPRISDLANASMIDSFWASLMNQRRLMPSMGKMPNCLGLNASTMTTTMGANKNT
jgi:hypothetical protein